MKTITLTGEEVDTLATLVSRHINVGGDREFLELLEDLFKRLTGYDHNEWMYYPAADIDVRPQDDGWAAFVIGRPEIEANGATELLAMGILVRLFNERRSRILSDTPTQQE